MILNKDAILNSDDLPTEVLNVPEWGGTVTIKAWSGSDLSRILGFVDKPSFYIDVAAASIVDDKGERIFSSPQDVQALSKKNGQAIKTIASAALDLNGLSASAAETDRGN